MIAYPNNGLLGYGLLAKPLPIVNVPEGATVARIRTRAGDFITVYLRRGNSFEKWYADFSDQAHTGLRLVYPAAADVRPR